MIILSLLFVLPVHASVEVTLLERLRSARSVQTIIDLRKDYYSLKETEQVCTIQRRTRAFPVACYTVLRIHTRWRVRPASELALAMKNLDEWCEREAKRAILHDDVVFPRVGQTSAVCERAMRRAREIRNYRKAEIFSTDGGANIETPGSL